MFPVLFFPVNAAEKRKWQKQVGCLYMGVEIYEQQNLVGLKNFGQKWLVMQFGNPTYIDKIMFDVWSSPSIIFHHYFKGIHIDIDRNGGLAPSTELRIGKRGNLLIFLEFKT